VCPRTPGRRRLLTVPQPGTYATLAPVRRHMRDKTPGGPGA